MASFDQLLKNSPVGNRSPQVTRQDYSGTLKTTISLGKTPTIVQKGPFYLCKDLPEASEVTGSMNLISYHGLENAYAKYCGKKMKEELTSVLTLPGNINLSSADDNSSLKSLIEKPPITGKELNPLSTSQLAGFRLHPGPLPEQHRLFAPQKKKSKKRSRQESELKPTPPALLVQEEGTSEPAKKPKKKDKDKSKKKNKEKKKKKDKDKGSGRCR
ncbi:MED19 [Bugula neritina]|uniref:Mediator of RNA polymerase II transcription subunit 19 n=1 Tax=Bugula neritina TaxID=10212 RepID=A0A7J7KSS4_BUGNE|nr:MED19 [Bugula neritina]